MKIALCDDEYLPLRSLCRYSGLSIRRLRDYLNDSAYPLPHYRVGGKILVRRSEFDIWIAAFHDCREASNINQLVNDVVSDLA